MSEHTAHDQAARVRYYLELGRTGEALALLATLLAEEPDSVELHELRAGALLDAGRHAEAVAAARAGLELDPDSIVILDILGLAHRFLGHLGEAEEALLAALRLQPEHPYLLAHYALVLGDGGVEKKAFDTLARAEAIAPHEIEVRRARVFLEYLFGRGKATRRHGRDLLAESPEDIVAHSILGADASGRGSSGAAKRHFEDAVRQDFANRELAEVALEARAHAHPLMWPLWPLHRLGVVVFYLVGVGGMLALSRLSNPIPFLVWLGAYLFICVYSWVAPPLIRRWVFRGRRS